MLAKGSRSSNGLTNLQRSDEWVLIPQTHPSAAAMTFSSIMQVLMAQRLM